METKILKEVTTILSTESVVIKVAFGGEFCLIDLPVRFVDPQISLQLAGAISSSPKFLRDADSENN